MRIGSSPTEITLDPTPKSCAGVTIGGSLAYIWRTPGHLLSSTYPTPIRHLSNIYPTNRKCLELGSSEKFLSGVMKAIEFENEVTLVAQPIGLP